MFLFVLGALGTASANPDWPPAEPVAVTTSDYTIHVVYKKVWYYGSTGERLEGPTLLVRGPNINVVYTGNLDYLKLLTATLLTAKAMGEPATFHYDKQNWVYLKYTKAGPNTAGEPDWALDGNRNSYALLRVEVK